MIWFNPHLVFLYLACVLSYHSRSSEFSEIEMVARIVWDHSPWLKSLVCKELQWTLIEKIWDSTTSFWKQKYNVRPKWVTQNERLNIEKSNNEMIYKNGFFHKKGYSRTAWGSNNLSPEWGSNSCGPGRKSRAEPHNFLVKLINHDWFLLGYIFSHLFSFFCFHFFLTCMFFSFINRLISI